MQLQHKVGSSQLKPPSPALVTGCIKAMNLSDMIHLQALKWSDTAGNLFYRRMNINVCDLSVCAGETVEQQETFCVAASECSPWRVWQCLLLSPAPLCLLPDAQPGRGRKRHAQLIWKIEWINKWHEFYISDLVIEFCGGLSNLHVLWCVYWR